MGGKSNHAKFVTEIPVLLAHICDQLPRDLDAEHIMPALNLKKMAEPEIMTEFIMSRLPQALEGGKTKFLDNFGYAQRCLSRVYQELRKNNIQPVTQVYWQPTEREKTGPDDPADITWANHPWLGVSVKSGAPNLYNLGTDPYGFDSERGQDLFEQLCTPEWQSLVKSVKTDLLELLSKNSSWSRKGKYVINLDTESQTVSLIKEGITKWTGTVQDFVNNQEPKGHRRVVGDYFQYNKKKYKPLGDALYAGLSDKLVNAHQSVVKSNKKLAGYHAGIASKPYVYMELSRKSHGCYLVPGIDDVEITVKSKPTTKTFGSGYVVSCDVIVNGHTATVDSYFRYHTGTLSGTPQNMIQNICGKENIWQSVPDL